MKRGTKIYLLMEKPLPESMFYHEVGYCTNKEDAEHWVELHPLGRKYKCISFINVYSEEVKP